MVTVAALLAGGTTYPTLLQYESQRGTKGHAVRRWAFRSWTRVAPECGKTSDRCVFDEVGADRVEITVGLNDLVPLPFVNLLDAAVPFEPISDVSFALVVFYFDDVDFRTFQGRNRVRSPKFNRHNKPNRVTIVQTSSRNPLVHDLPSVCAEFASSLDNYMLGAWEYLQESMNLLERPQPRHNLVFVCHAATLQIESKKSRRAPCSRERYSLPT